MITTEWRKELDEMYRRLTAAITTGHYPEELIDHYSDEARILPPGHPIIVGKEGKALPKEITRSKLILS